jgi:hypothetical protein
VKLVDRASGNQIKRDFGWLRRLALGLLHRETSFKASLKRKRYKALLNHDYRCTILAVAFT